jgi:predicted deacylase
LTTVYTFDEDTVSDLHKDAYGFRPAQYWFQAWHQMTDAEKQSVWDQLLLALERSNQREAEEKKQAIERFEKSVTATIESGAADRATAIRWLMDGARANGDTEYYEFLVGLPYGYIAKFDQ